MKKLLVSCVSIITLCILLVSCGNDEPYKNYASARVTLNTMTFELTEDRMDKCDKEFFITTYEEYAKLNLSLFYKESFFENGDLLLIVRKVQDEKEYQLMNTLENEKKLYPVLTHNKQYQTTDATDKLLVFFIEIPKESGYTYSGELSIQEN